MIKYTFERRRIFLWQKFMYYTNEEKEEIFNKYLNGIPSLQLEKEYGISSSTIREWKYKTNHPELITGNKKTDKNKN